MESRLGETLAAIAGSEGFQVTVPYCRPDEMIRGIRQLTELRPGAELSPLQNLALIENARRVIVKTAAIPEARDSLSAQAALPRWRHLRRASPAAADAYAAVLGYLGLDVPQCLVEEPDVDQLD